MQLRRWNSLPDVMKTKEVRKYYNIIKRRQVSLKLKLQVRHQARLRRQRQVLQTDIMSR